MLLCRCLQYVSFPRGGVVRCLTCVISQRLGGKLIQTHFSSHITIRYFSHLRDIHFMVLIYSNNFSAQFIKIMFHYKKIAYYINVLQTTACLVVNPIIVGIFAFLFHCNPAGQTSDSMTVPT